VIRRLRGPIEYSGAVTTELLSDVPSPIDLRDPGDAHAWVLEADVKRPWRAQVRDAFVEALGAVDSLAGSPVRRILELGSGPGLLAERILRTCDVERYTLFDFSPPMLEMSRARVEQYPAAAFVLGDFKKPDWTRGLEAPFDAVVTMQAVHEIRHKRHVPGLYRQVHALLRPGGVLLVSDHVPADDTPRKRALFATEEEQHAAMRSAGFERVATRLLLSGLYLITGTRG
jgi:SAM-dependent methyltransferase